MQLLWTLLVLVTVGQRCNGGLSSKVSLSSAPADLLKESSCPEAGAIAPCICWQSLDVLDMDCSNVASEQQLESIFRDTYFPVKSFGSFFLQNNKNISRFGNIFNGATFEKIEIISTSVDFVSELFLYDSVYTLKSWWMEDSPVTTDTFPFLSLTSYENLSDLVINSGELSYVPLIASSSLTYVVFGGNKINKIEPGTFSQLPSLQTVDLRSNDLSFLETGSFQLRNGFNELVLNNNSLSTMQAGVFSLPEQRDSLELHLLMDQNLMTQLNEDVFSEVFPNITSLSIAENPLLCGCDLLWLVTNSLFLGKVNEQATCVNGTRLIDLDPTNLIESCA